MSQVDGLTEAGLKTPKAAAVAGVVFSLLTLVSFGSVSYTHLTLPTILRV